MQRGANRRFEALVLKESRVTRKSAEDALSTGKIADRSPQVSPVDTVQQESVAADLEAGGRCKISDVVTQA